jgi:cysteine synthase
MVRRLAREAGVFVGWSAGAAVVAAERAQSAGVTVVIGPDSGMRYLSERRRLTGDPG